MVEECSQTQGHLVMKGNKAYEEKDVLVFSFHNWQGRRFGGFHRIGETIARRGHRVVFCSYPRVVHKIFSNDERYSNGMLFRLTKGINCKVGGGNVFNFTVPSLLLPLSIRRRFPRTSSLLNFLSDSILFFRVSFLCHNPACIIFESTQSVLLLPRFKKRYPNAFFVYRPSDPLVGVYSDDKLIAAEKEVIESVDLNLFVNCEGYDLYKMKGWNLGKFHILPNGLNLDEFRRTYPRPLNMPASDVALYVGALNPDWRFLIKLSQILPHIKFLIICPARPVPDLMNRIRGIKNIHYIPGVTPEKVAHYITNCDVFLIPYEDKLADRPVGLHSKVFQAMAAKKPIIGKGLNEAVEKAGVFVTKDLEEFARLTNNALGQEVRYNIDLEEYDWEKFSEKLIEYLPI